MFKNKEQSTTNNTYKDELTGWFNSLRYGRSREVSELKTINARLENLLDNQQHDEPKNIIPKM